MKKKNGNKQRESTQFSLVFGWKKLVWQLQETNIKTQATFLQMCGLFVKMRSQMKWPTNMMQNVYSFQ